MESDDGLKIRRGARTLAGHRFVTIGQAVDLVMARLRRAVEDREGDVSLTAAALDAAPNTRAEDS